MCAGALFFLEAIVSVKRLCAAGACVARVVTNDLVSWDPSRTVGSVPVGRRDDLHHDRCRSAVVVRRQVPRSGIVPARTEQGSADQERQDAVAATAAFATPFVVVVAATIISATAIVVSARSRSSENARYHGRSQNEIAHFIAPEKIC